LLMDKAIENNMYYHPATSNSREERHRFIRQERSSKSELKLSDSEMHDILTELKVPDLAQAKSKSERVIVTRLREKIVEDFVHDHHEAGEIMMRKAGFWRWANRRTYNRLAANGRIYDWKNGEALAPVGENEVDGEGYEAPAAADDLVADHDEEVIVDKEDTDKDDDANDDMSSVVSITSEASRFRPAYSSSASRDTSISSASRTTLLSNDESADDGWTTVGRARPKAALTITLTPNGGLKHLRSIKTPRTLKTFAAAFSMLSIPDEKIEYESDGDDAVSPLTPCPRRR
jgi:hypothetical protein